MPASKIDRCLTCDATIIREVGYVTTSPQMCECCLNELGSQDFNEEEVSAYCDICDVPRLKSALITVFTDDDESFTLCGACYEEWVPDEE